MEKIKTEININDFPARIRPFLAGATVYDSSCGQGAIVYYADSGYYIKTAPHHSLAREAAMGRLFYAKGMGAQVMEYITTDKDYLVTRSVAGQDFTHYLENPEKLCRLYATALRRLHSQPLENAPVSPKYSRYMAVAENSAENCRYDDWVRLKAFTPK